MEQGPRQQAPIERIDADAVCEECGSVNPEDTLLCKTCGNNLRDQRLRRVHTEGASDEGVRQGARLTWLTKVLGGVGVLLIVFVAINIGRFEQAMTKTSSNDPSVFWEGASAAPLDALARELAANPVTPQESAYALEHQAQDDAVDGRYLLVDRDQEVPIGQGIVRVENDTYYFVAVLSPRSAEVRGCGYLEGSARIASRDKSAVQVNGKRYSASGFAQRVPGGAFECFGLSDADNESYAVLAYRIVAGTPEKVAVPLDQNP